MRIKHIVGASLLASCVGGSARAAGPGVPGILDRPTPPACCADGICYPNPATWGAYPTRWRRWPGEVLTPADLAAPTRPGLLPTLEPPGPEDEDRRAPPPTPVPAEEPEANGEIRRPAVTPPTTLPATPPVETPGTTPVTPPSGLDTTPGSPFEDDEPNEMENGLPFHSRLGPPGDDPPPAPPFRAPAVAEITRPLKAEPPKAATSPAPIPRAAAPSPSSESDDPPPAFPLTLG
jgi:hypothetical protein